MQLVLAKMSTMPILASALIAPTCSPLGFVTSSVLTADQRKDLLKAYGVPDNFLNVFTTDGEAFSDLTNEEKHVIVDYQGLIAPYGPGYCINRPFTEEELNLWSRGYHDRDAEALNALMASIADSIDVSRYNNVPFLMFSCEGDGSVFCDSVKWMHKVFSRAGYNAQIHVFPASENPLQDGGDHRFEINPENCVTYKSSRGVEIDDVPIVYVEILAFWRSFENQNV
jgi:hypothetical protein